MTDAFRLVLSLPLVIAGEALAEATAVVDRAASWLQGLDR